jgi:hypothetical protein
MAVGESMRQLRKTVLTLLVWATAASILVANTPHYVCRCPNGQVKEFCLGVVSEESTCCCSGETSSSKSNSASCCQGGSTSNSKGKKPCCGGHATDRGSGLPAQQGTRGNPSDEHPTVSRTCCHRTVAQPDGQLVIRPEAKDDKSFQVSVALLALPAPVPVILSLAAAKTLLQISIPPPTDLVVVLQRLTI